MTGTKGADSQIRHVIRVATLAATAWFSEVDSMSRVVYVSE
jgi:hypothetical protein